MKLRGTGVRLSPAPQRKVTNMSLKKRSQEVTSTNDIFYVSYEDEHFVYFINDGVAFKIECDSKDSDSQDRALAAAADVIIEKATKRVCKSRWF